MRPQINTYVLVVVYISTAITLVARLMNVSHSFLVHRTNEVSERPSKHSRHRNIDALYPKVANL